MAQLVAYLHFNGNCREAMTFYKDCLGGELTLMPIGESQMAADVPKEAHNNILHSALERGDFTLMGADGMGTDGTVKGNSSSLCLVCTSKEEIERFFSKLSAGGNVTHPLKEEFFGTFGDLTDKFGFDWMFQFDPNAKAK